MHVHDHLPLADLEQLAKAIPEKRPWKRYQAVILVIGGRDAGDIAIALHRSVRSVQSRVRRYNQGGPDALREGKHTGRPPRLGGPELERFRRRVEAGSSARALEQEPLCSTGCRRPDTDMAGHRRRGRSPAALQADRVGALHVA